MKKALTLLLFCWAFVSQVTAQIPNESPIPVEFRVESQDGLIRAFDYTSAVAWCDTLTQTVTGEIAWAYGDSLGLVTDSLLCDSNMIFNDLTGKVALIRRGICNFSLKAWNAQQAGAVAVIIVDHTYIADGGALVNMAAGINADLVTIPTIFITRDDGDIILDKLDNGIPITGILEVRAFGGPRTAYSYQTPQEAIKPLEDVGITFLNIDATTTLPTVTINAEFTDPNGQTTTLSQSLNDVPPLSVNNIKFDDSYTPSAVGTYNVRFTNSITPDELEQSFIITDDHTLAHDNGNLIPNTNGTLENDSAGFVNSGFRFDIGNFYRTGPNPITATHVTFVLGNHTELYTGEPTADVMYINIYNADPDGNGSVPYPASFTSYAGLNENGGPLIPVAATEYIIKDTDQDFQFTTVELPDPVTLAANKIYLVTVEYSGLEAGSGIPPKFAFGGDARPAGELASIVFDDSLRTRGYNVNYFLRLNLDGFATSTDNPLDDGKVVVSPNPASRSVNLELSLENTADVVEVVIFDFTGRMVSSRTLDNVQKGRFSFDVSNLANGTYFMSINTPEGFRSKKFQVVR